MLCDEGRRRPARTEDLVRARRRQGLRFRNPEFPQHRLLQPLRSSRTSGQGSEALGSSRSALNRSGLPACGREPAKSWRPVDRRTAGEVQASRKCKDFRLRIFGGWDQKRPRWRGMRGREYGGGGDCDETAHQVGVVSRCAVATSARGLGRSDERANAETQARERGRSRPSRSTGHGWFTASTLTACTSGTCSPARRCTCGYRRKATPRRIGQVAIAGKRVAWITDDVAGNSMETNENLVTTVLGRYGVRTLAHAFRYWDFVEPQPGHGTWLWRGDWIDGLVGSGGFLAVSSVDDDTRCPGGN